VYIDVDVRIGRGVTRCGQKRTRGWGRGSKITKFLETSFMYSPNCVL